jgi:hypothetical protein
MGSCWNCFRKGGFRLRRLAPRTGDHPAGKATPAEAPAKKAPAKAAKPAEKLRYAATARNGKTNAVSATPLVAALDIKIAGRNGAQITQDVIVGFYASKEKAQGAADEINGSKVADWSDARVVAARRRAKWSR